MVRYQCMEKSLVKFLICRKPAMSIWAHLGRVNRISTTEGLVMPIYRYATTYITHFYDFAFECANYNVSGKLNTMAIPQGSPIL